MARPGEAVALTLVSAVGEGRDGKELVADWFRWGLARGKIVRVCGAERAAVQLDKRPKGLIPGTEHKSKT